MNRLVIIGNGFDLAHGLKTRYEDFINWYWDKRVDDFVGNTTNVSEDCLCKLTIKESSNISCWNVFAFEYSYFKDFRGNRTSLGYDVIKEIRNRPDIFDVESTQFFQAILHSIETKGWVDIENDYYDLLIKYAKEESPKEKIDELNKQLSFLQEKLIEYLSRVNSQEVSINDNIKNRIYAPFCEKDIAIEGKQALDEHIKYGVNLDDKEWEHKLWQYGKDIASCMPYVQSFKQRYEKGEEILECDKTEILLPNQIMLLNFNYTKTADLYVSSQSDFAINHIHGKLEKPDSVIFGYGDELDENYKKLENLRECDGLHNIKSIKYLEAESYRKVLAFIESDFYQILIMGHSCGNSDRTLLNTLFEHKNCVSIKPYFHKIDQQKTNYLEIAQNISRNFTDMKLMRDRVVNKVYCEPLT